MIKKIETRNGDTIEINAPSVRMGRTAYEVTIGDNITRATALLTCDEIDEFVYSLLHARGRHGVQPTQISLDDLVLLLMSDDNEWLCMDERHYILKNNVAISALIATPDEPISDDNMQRYLQQIRPFVAALDPSAYDINLRILFYGSLVLSQTVTVMDGGRFWVPLFHYVENDGNYQRKAVNQGLNAFLQHLAPHFNVPNHPMYSNDVMWINKPWY